MDAGSVRKAALFQPEQAVAGPRMRMRKRRLVLQTHAVPAFFVDMQVERNMVFAQRLGEQQRVLHRHGFILKCRPQKTRRCVRCHLQLVGKRPDKRRRRVCAKQIVP